MLKFKYMRKVFISALIVFAAAVTMPGLAFAQLSVNESNKDTQDSTGFDQRQEERKKRHDLNLTEAEETTLKDKCQAAQGKASSVSQGVNGIATSRAQVYTNILTRLNKQVERLKLKDVDTAKLEASIDELTRMIITLGKNLDAYKLAIDDMVAIKCQDDPEGFKAALLDAREGLQQVRSDSKDITTYVRKDVINNLKNAKKLLKEKE
jgi:hypothetical protein